MLFRTEKFGESIRMVRYGKQKLTYVWSKENRRETLNKLLTRLTLRKITYIAKVSYNQE